MKKMPCVFQRDFSDRRKPVLLRDVTPGCEWVLAGEGTATRKWDGTACLVQGGQLFKRYDAKINRKTGERLKPPEGWIPCQSGPDPVTGHWPGWVPIGAGPEDAWHREAWGRNPFLAPGTYELCGPKIGGNPERFTLEHVLIPHGNVTAYLDRSWEGMRDFLAGVGWEGLVFHGPDGATAKIRRADFGFPWPLKAEENAA